MLIALFPWRLIRFGPDDLMSKAFAFWPSRLP